MPIELYPSVAKVKRNGVYQNLPGFGLENYADIEAMLANSETGTTAQYTHLKDSYFILNDILYQADENIPAGETISVGTNCHVAIMGDDVTNLIKNVDNLKDSVIFEKTATGEIVFFDDAEEEKPSALSVEIPYISGGVSSMTMRFHGRNMLTQTGNLTNAGVTYTRQDDGTIKINGTASGNSRYGFFGSTSYASASNCYNLPKGRYTFFARNTTGGNYSVAWHIYKGTSTTKIADSATSIVHFNNPTSQSGRVSNQLSSGSVYNNAIFKVFLGVGDCELEDWDAPSTRAYEVTVSFGATIYGGTVDLINGTITSKYASDGTELVNPELLSIAPPTIPTLNKGANTIWASIIGSTVTVTYGNKLKTYVDDKLDIIQEQLDETEEKADTAINRIKDTFCSLAMFEKIGIIGDSYATGSLYIPNGSGATYVGTYNNLSWGKNISRMFDIMVSFFAHGGLSTKTWLTDTTNGIAALEAAAQSSPCNLYWFGLGINDVGLYNANNSYLGSLTDISEHEQGTDWAQTFYGNVGQIIERVQAAAPNSKIVISSFVGYRPRSQTAGDIALNNALQAIAEYYNLPFINLKSDPFYMSDYYTNNILGKHPIAMVYSGMANANVRLLGKAVFEYQTYFKDYHMGTPTPDPEPDDPT